MIVASHQPNFLPYMGFFYKMYMCDVFTLSDTVMFSRSGFHNYNYIRTDMEKSKLTVPVTNKNGLIRDVELCEWEHNRNKLIKRLQTDYGRAPYFDFVFPHIEFELRQGYVRMSDLNESLIKVCSDLLGIDCHIIKESLLDITGDAPTAQIADICKKTKCRTYLSGTGAKEYLDEELLRKSGVKVIWSSYEPDQSNLSVLHYLMQNGPTLPDGWKQEREELHKWAI